MMRRITVFMTLSLLLVCHTVSAKGLVSADPEKVDDDFAIQGEYEGTISVEGGMKIGVQVIAGGEGKFTAVAFANGLPGTSDDVELLERIEAKKAEDGSVKFDGAEASGIVQDGKVKIVSEGEELGVLEKSDRKSPTLGKAPPEGAKVLFSGKDTDAENWKKGKVVDGLLHQGTTSNDTFGDHKLHIEFRLPYAPEARGQGRGNSGMYLQGRYEVQMLDSFGLKGENNECGGIYSIAAPDLNMCYPPLSWQTYDVDFTAAKYDEDGELLKNARMTVKHNGVLIHENVELPKTTTAAPNKAGPEPGPIHLQNHGNPVRYRNIWVVPKS